MNTNTARKTPAGYPRLVPFKDNKALMAYNMVPSGAAAQWDSGNYSSAYSRDILDKAKAIKTNNYTAD